MFLLSYHAIPATDTGAELVNSYIKKDLNQLRIPIPGSRRQRALYGLEAIILGSAIRKVRASSFRSGGKKELTSLMK